MHPIIVASRRAARACCGHLIWSISPVDGLVIKGDEDGCRVGAEGAADLFVFSLHIADDLTPAGLRGSSLGSLSILWGASNPCRPSLCGEGLW